MRLSFMHCYARLDILPRWTPRYQKRRLGWEKGSIVTYFPDESSEEAEGKANAWVSS